MIILPRQAQDKHRKKHSQKRDDLFSCCSGAIYAGEALRVVATHNASVRKMCLLRHSYTKTIILPRQARDIHRESAQKQTRFSQEPLFLYVAWQINHTPLQVPAAYLARFTHINDTRRKTYLLRSILV
jgi:hypothetical protein